MIKLEYGVFDDGNKIERRNFNEFNDAFDYAQGGLMPYIYVDILEDGKIINDDNDIVWTWDDTWTKEDAARNAQKIVKNILFDNGLKADECLKESQYNFMDDEPEDDGIVQCCNCTDFVDFRNCVKDRNHGWICKDCLPEVEASGMRLDLDQDYGTIDESVSVNVNADSADEMISFTRAVLGDNIDFFDQDFDNMPPARADIPAVVEEPECEGPECDVECEGPECEGPNPEPEFEEPAPEEPDPRPDTKEVDLTEDHTGNPEERTTHLEYTDNVPTDDKFPMPKNITKKEDNICKINKGILHDEDSKKDLKEANSYRDENGKWVNPHISSLDGEDLPVLTKDDAHRMNNVEADYKMLDEAADLPNKRLSEGYYIDRAIRLFGGYPEDYSSEDDALDQIIEYYQTNNMDFEDVMEAIDPDYRAKYAEWNGNTLDYYINGYGDDLDFVAEIFKKYYANKPGDYKLIVGSRQLGTEKTFNINESLKESLADDEDDMTDEEFVEAFGKALAEKKAAKNLEEDKDDFNPDSTASDELDAEADDAAEISEISLKAYRDSLKDNKLTESPTNVLANCNFDIQEYDIPTHKGENEVTVEVDILGPTAEDWYEGKEVTLVCESYYDTDNLDFDREEDGEPTYVPYGEQSVMYDDGKGQVIGVDVDSSEFEIDNWYFKEFNGTRELTDDEAAKILEVSENDLKIIIEAAKHDASEFIADYLRDSLVDDANDWDWDW